MNAQKIVRCELFEDAEEWKMQLAAVPFSKSQLARAGMVEGGCVCPAMDKHIMFIDKKLALLDKRASGLVACLVTRHDAVGVDTQRTPGDTRVFGRSHCFLPPPADTIAVNKTILR